MSKSQALISYSDDDTALQEEILSGAADRTDEGRAMAEAAGLSAEELEALYGVQKFNPHHDERGRFTTGPATGGGVAEDAHRGLEGYSSKATLGPDGKIYTSDVDDAVKALNEDRDVVLEQPDQVSTLLDRLAVIAKEAAERGEKAPVYDLCRVSIAGTNLFCAGSLGINRIEMPQLTGTPLPGSRAAEAATNLQLPVRRGKVDISGQFRSYLAGKGFSINDDTVQASHLRATQNELNGVKVAGYMQRLRNGEPVSADPIFTSRDNYILDGHHRWAGAVAAEFDAATTTDVNLPITRVDLDIVTLLKEAKAFAAEWGIPQIAKRRVR